MTLIIFKKNTILKFYINFSFNILIKNLKQNLKNLFFLPFFATYKLNNLKNKFLIYNKAFLNSTVIKLKQYYNEISIGYYSELIAIGVGFKFEKLGKKNNCLVLSLGYSHYIYYIVDPKVNFRIVKNYLFLFSTNLNLLKKIVYEIKLYKIPDVYKGKGIRYLKQNIKLKQGKKKR